MGRFARNLSFIMHPCVFVAMIVVSDMNDRLSPKKAPPTAMAVMKATLWSVFSASPAAMGTSAAMVPTEVPTDRLMKHAAMKSPAMIM